MMRRPCDSIEIFVENVKHNILNYLPKEEFKDAVIRITHVTQEGNTGYIGLSIAKPNAFCSPVIPLENFYNMYQSGKSYEQILFLITEKYLSYQANVPDISYLKNWDDIKDHIYARFISTQSLNENYLKHRPVHILSDTGVGIIWNVDIKEFSNHDGERVSAAVTYDFLNAWNISLDTLKKSAAITTQKNYPAVIQPLEKLFPPEQYPPITIPMIVVSTQQLLYGSIAILYDGVYDTVKNMLHDDIYIIPSSTHEVICVGKSNISPNYILEMVTSVNQTEVEPKDFLADDVWEFQGYNLVSAIHNPKYYI